MRTIADQLAIAKKQKKIALMTHVVAGYPSIAETIQIVKEMERAGVDLIEIQIPFSDPLADGPVIMAANDHALAQGMITEKAFDLMQTLSTKVKIPLLFMGYFNTVFHYGTKQFCQQAAAAGAQGLIIPDVPYDEEGHEGFIAACKKVGLAQIRVLSPTSTPERIKANCQIAQSFIYCTAHAGITGTKSELSPATKKYLASVRRHTNLPLAVGFGISQPAQVKALIGSADIAVIGSAVIQEIAQNGVGSVHAFVSKLVKAGKGLY
jgi:tryptophan synthase alpha chain